jgi:hypothetical protein
MGMEEEDQARPDRRAGTERSNWANGGPLSRSPPGLPEPAEGSAPWRFLLFGPAPSDVIRSWPGGFGW